MSPITFIIEKDRKKINTWRLIEREWYGVGRPDYRTLKYLTFSEVIKIFKDKEINQNLWGCPPKPPVEIR